ncbi:ATP-binding protein [Aquabacterium humicola]|uniref:ATP-binding protein n=1 Tax=Aquabacterium humicola TaxID=3237377 RepID=UPI002542E8B4|nr:biotin carboxylase N-terminal domain-containing protein [Rubrivivax pictus]
MSFHKILIANRGEIACRVIRTARALGYRTVAVYSDADAQAPHVRLADEAVRLGPAPAAESYLKIDAVLAAARATGADALHPGYGFLSERADFAAACAEAGLVFIGPPPSAIDAMGHKAAAKRRMLEAGVPCAPGYLGDEQSDERLRREAEVMGYPLLVKAVAGGGGRGMRLVRSGDDVVAALAGARREAESAFGDGRLMLERLIEHGRHIEIQVFADRHGNAIHLGERDCTAQRRRQKVIEEAPSPIVDATLRARMGADAVAAALAVGYVGAGTVEFIVDAQHRHYFLEMNTRLQVEHPVTECVTGLDLVEWQLRVAAGEPLPLQQSDVRLDGHAIEVRLYAEDPYAGFAPQTGRVLHWRPEAALQAANPGGALRDSLRIDAGIVEGGEIGPYYDPMVAKLIVHGRNRGDAIRRLSAALEDLPLVGPANNGRFLRDLLRHPDFAQARLHTTLIDQWAADGEPLLQRPRAGDDAWRVAALLRASGDGLLRPAGSPGGLRSAGSAGGLRSAGSAGGLLRSAGTASFDLTLVCDGEQRRLRVTPRGGGAVDVATNGDTLTLRVIERDGRCLVIEQAGVRRRWLVVEQPAASSDGAAVLHIVHDGAVFRFEEPSALPVQAASDDPRRACAPVAGLVAQLLVRAGDRVEAGQPLASVEAMKMEMWLVAGTAGTVAAVHVAPRDAVSAGALLVELAPEEQTA